MDCLQVCEVLSASHDREPVDATLLAEAGTHADRCTSCGAFRSLLERADAAAPPRATDALIDRLVTRTAPIAADLRSAAPAPHLLPTARSAARDRVQRSWMPRFAAFATAAMVLLVALTAGTVALVGSLSQTALESTSPDQLRTTEAPSSDQGTYDAAGAEDTAASTAAEIAIAPPYITLGDEVWVLAEAAAPAPSAPATAGMVTSSLDGGVSGDLPAFHAGTDRTMLYVAAADGRYLAFTRVVRTLGRAEYGLVSGVPLTGFGMWPTLPERFTQPTEADGAPTFRYFGFDDNGVDVYVPAGGRIQDGFALAPGTLADDPAAGNPNWTWWQRLE